MSRTADIETRGDIEALLRRFYGRALVDDLLAEPFTEVRDKGLESHLPVMCDFWETVLFGAGPYRGSALRVHERVRTRHPFGAPHFDRWLTLWRATVDEMYAGPRADRAKVQGTGIATAMNRRLSGLPSVAAEALRIGSNAEQGGRR
ncbi:group III truncated hemoglobin [Rhodococcus spelaei]|uniref:Group III truncated hemoglobin n=1 Tax=Rhodococcus spelaei TaxID=2546320 RepID=A0A541AZ90_9NOCA|nr:group III truncated hemoglobin [Rhodococcus spelaei]TQF65372.1 group III truncated hemoglobin [Rhodococcus spelaei]